MIRLLALLISLWIAAPAGAADGERPVHVILGVGLADGGSRVEYAGGTSNLHAGDGRLLYAGVLVRLGDTASLQLSAGNHKAESFWFFSNDEFRRNIVDVIGHYHLTDKVRLGGGAEFIRNASLRGVSVPSGTEQNYKNTVGAVLEVEYRFRPWFGLKLRGTAVRYESSDSAVRFNGDHVAVLCNFYL